MATTVTIHNQTNKSSAIVVVGDAGDQTVTLNSLRSTEEASRTPATPVARSAISKVSWSTSTTAKVTRGSTVVLELSGSGTMKVGRDFGCYIDGGRDQAYSINTGGGTVILAVSKEF